MEVLFFPFGGVRYVDYGANTRTGIFYSVKSKGIMHTVKLPWTSKVRDCYHADFTIQSEHSWFYGTYTMYDPYWGRWTTVNNEYIFIDGRGPAKSFGWEPIYGGESVSQYVNGNQFWVWDGHNWYLKLTILDFDLSNPYNPIVNVYDHQYNELDHYGGKYVYLDDTIPALPEESFPNKVSDGELLAAAIDEIRGYNTNMIANIISVKDLATQGSEKCANICNILETGDIFEFADLLDVNIKRGEPMNLNKLKKLTWEQASNKWLKYRYELCTTLSDIVEIKDKADTVIDNIFRISRNDMPPRKFGATVAKDGVTYSLTGTYQCDFHNEVQKLWYQLDQLGLQPNLQNIWDMVPYSFVVDWFLPLGDYFSHVDRAFLFGNKSLSESVYSCPYRIYDLFVSTKENGTIDCGTGWHAESSIYTRRCLQHVPSLVFYSDSYEPSSKTWIKRVLDGASLFIHV